MSAAELPLAAAPGKAGVLAPDQQAWLASWTLRHGRAPRVLHIGNIANNAYNNAKLLNAAGFNCDVLCVDYYHIMGTPEWEDADFEGELEDQFLPNWTRVDLRGFQRPRWFVQGPARLCLEYLAARNAGRQARSRVLWHELALINQTQRLECADWRARLYVTAYRWRRCALEFLSPARVAPGLRQAAAAVAVFLARPIFSTGLARWLLGGDTVSARRGSVRAFYERWREALTSRLLGQATDAEELPPVLWRDAASIWMHRHASHARKFGRRLQRRIGALEDRATEWLARWHSWPPRGQILTLAVAAVIYVARAAIRGATRLAAMTFEMLVDGLTVLVERPQGALGEAARRRPLMLLPLLLAEFVLLAFSVLLRLVAVFASLAAEVFMWLVQVLRIGLTFIARTVLELVIFSYVGLTRGARRMLSPASPLILLLPRRWRERLMPQDPDELAARVQQLEQRFRAEFPERSDQLSANDLAGPLHLAPLWREVLGAYDLVVAYSTDPIHPLLAGRRYFAFEHGTLRDIPFEDTARGRITALGYRCAEHAFVTNYDCLDNARILAGDRHSFINHPYDEDHGLHVSGAESLRAELCAALDADFLLFFPTRHDWVPGTGYADKANDELLRAFVALRRSGRRVGMVCCRWGRNVEQSTALLVDGGCAEHVRWVEPMGIVRFDRMCRACHMVADQFRLGAFGGVMFKALAVGAPVCTFIEPALIGGLFPEVPPVINCRTSAEIERALVTLIDDPAALAAQGRLGRDWIERYHSGGEVVRKQVAQFKNFLESVEEDTAGCA